MIHIHTLLVGEPRRIVDADGAWESAICRSPVAVPVELGLRGLAGDRVADTRHHGAPEQAVCCHPLDHYAYWNEAYGLDAPEQRLGPGSVGENWTLAGATERDVCVGDVFQVGTARVQVTGPRFPCSKQERKLGLPGFLRRTMETMRTGFYLRVLTPGMVQAGDAWELETSPHPSLTVHAINASVHQTLDPDTARIAVDAPEIAPIWKSLLQRKLSGQWPAG